MRLATLLVAALACTSAKVAAPVEFRTIASGGYGVAEERKAVLATTDAEYRAQWQALVRDGQMPAVDFDEHVVVFLTAGRRNTGGWTVEPVSVRVEGDTAIVDAKIEGPPPRGITTQAITYPYAVLAIRRRGVEKVRWD